MKYTARHIRRYLEQGRIDPDLWKSHFPFLLESGVPECRDCGDFKSNLCQGGKDPVDCFLGIGAAQGSETPKKARMHNPKDWDGAGTGRKRLKKADKVFDQSKM